MGKRNKKKASKRSSKWTPPKGSSAYFSATSDEAFKQKHPVGYFFLVLLGIAALLSPIALYLIFVIPLANNSQWLMLGWVGGFIVGIGFFNFVAIIIKQYLGHWVSILSFVLGGFLILVSLIQMGIV